MSRAELLAYLAENSPFPAWAWENSCKTVRELRKAVADIRRADKMATR